MLRLSIDQHVVRRVQNLYQESITIVVNNQHGRVLLDKTGSLRHGGCASFERFCFGIVHLIIYLEKRLQGILLYSLPVHGPVLQGQHLPPLETRYKVQGYLDDCIPAITSTAEYQLVDTACSLFERSSGCKLHRNPDSNKCKVLLLGLPWSKIVC